MSLVLGIDTGGTFTDGVIINLETKEIIANAKSPTTHQDLIIGIRSVIHALNGESLAAIDYLALSTTLATNAIVENHGCRVGLLLLGHRHEGKLPPCLYQEIVGSCNIRGEETVVLDTDAIKNTLLSWKNKVDAVAISGIFSVRNPEQEKTARQLVREILGCPVVCAHELASALGMDERTVTTVLNAKLLYIIDDLIGAVDKVLKERDIDVPIMVVKGDGSLMNETTAKERPIETILSGPAASIIGANYLNGSENGLVLDMGGTTTDIAILQNGLPRLNQEGAKVGGWRTRVAAVEAATFGLGGDSHIGYDNGKKEFTVGPRRNWPVSMICKEYPHYLQELEIASYATMPLMEREHCEGYLLLHHASPYMELSEEQKRLLDLLEDGPHTLVYLARELDMSPGFMPTEALLVQGLIGPIGFTPTDILHLKGTYLEGSLAGAELAASMMAKHHGMRLPAFIDACVAAINEKMCRVIFDSLMTYENAPVEPFGNDAGTEYLFQSAIGKKPSPVFANRFDLGLPIIGIGAPIRCWLPASAENFHTEAVFPDHCDVANAVGAAAGKVMNIFRILVQNHDIDGIDIYAPWGKQHYVPRAQREPATMKDAVAWAVKEGRERMETAMQLQGMTDYEIIVEQKDVTVGSYEDNTMKLHIETKLEIAAIGRPQNCNRREKQKSLLGKFWGKDKTPDFSMIPSASVDGQHPGLAEEPQSFVK